MIAAGHAEDAARSYRQWLRVTSVIVAPPALVIALFAPEILLLWTGSRDAVNAAGLLTTILVLGTAANILMVVPYALQVAQGSMAAMLRLNLALIALQAGVIAWAVPAFGAIGAACGWLAVNVVYILVGVPMVHRSVFGRTLPTSFVGQVGPPIVAAAMVVIPARWLLQRSWAPAHAATLIAGTLGVALLAAFGAARFFPAAAARGEG